MATFKASESDLTSAEAQELCSKFLLGSWTRLSVDNFSMKVLSGGMSNRLFTCENLTSGEKVVVRQYGGKIVQENHPYRTLDEIGEVLLFYKLGDMGLGPKLLGAFPGGRLEEFIQGHPLNNEDYADADFELKFARSMAQMHSLDIPTRKDIVDQLAISQRLTDEFEETVRPRLSPDIVARFEDLFQFDYNAEIEWLKEVRPQIPSRVVLSHHDMNRANFLIRDSDRKLVFLDFEFSGYSLRGSDIGAHFNNQMFQVTNLVDFTSGLEYPDEATRRKFADEYLRETKQIGKFVDFDELGLDSVDSLLMDADFHSLVSGILFTIWFLRDYFEIVNFGDAFFKFTTIYTRFYRKQKIAFLEKYAKRIKK